MLETDATYSNKKIINKLGIESKKRCTTSILDMMENDLSNTQLLHLNKVLNEEFNKITLLPREKHVDMISINEENQRLLNNFLDAKTVEGLSPKSLDKYKRDIQYLLDWSVVSVINMSSEDIREFLSMWKRKGNCQNITIDGMRRSYSTFFRFLADNGYILKNPMTRVKKIKTRKLYKKAFSGRELELLRNAIPKDDLRMKAMFELLLSSGIRISELSGMRVSNIDWDESTFIVLGKGNKEREVFFNDLAKVSIKRYLASRDDDDNPALFVGLHKPHNRLSGGGISDILKKIGERAGVNNVHAHRFRRHFATTLLNKGVHIEQIQQLLGHAEIETTQMYVSSDEDEIKYNHKRFSN